MKKIKSLISVLLAAVLIAGILPLTVFADGETTLELLDGYTLNADGEGRFEITSVADWNALADYVASGKNCKGKSFIMTADLGSASEPVTKTIGRQTGPKKETRMRFAGTFDGGDNTICVALRSDDTLFSYNPNYVAPFAYTKDVTIKNLRVEGSIYTTATFAGGLIGSGDGYSTLDHVQVSVTIQNYYTVTGTSYANHGGIIGIAEGGALIENSFFDGEFTGTDYQHSGGFIGLNKGKSTLNNCLFNPTISTGLNVNGASEFIHYTKNQKDNYTKCYSTALFGDPQNAQGTRVHTSVKAGDVYETVTAADGNTYYNITGNNLWEALFAFEEGQTEKTVVLEDDLTAGSEDTALILSGGKTLTLDLNGHTLDRGLGDKAAVTNGYVIKVSSNAKLNIINSAESAGVIKGGRSKNTGGGIVAENNAKLSISGKLTVSDNYLNTAKNNVSLGGNSVITVTGPINGSYIGITKNVNYSEITSGLSVNSGISTGHDCFFSDSDKYALLEDEHEVLILRLMNVSAVTANDNGESIGDIQISPSYPIYYERIITLTAPSVSGYKFLGWFDGEKKLSAALKFELTVKEDIALTAKYEAIPTEKAVVEIETANDAKYTATIDGTEHDGDYTFTNVTVGEQITVTASDKDKVLQWENTSGKIMGRGESLTFTAAPGKTTVRLVYKYEMQGAAYVQFVSLSGQVLYAGTFDDIRIDSLVIPCGPTKAGCSFSGWMIKGTDLEATAENIKALIQAGNTLITAEPSYLQQNIIYTVTVNYSLAVPSEIYTGIPVGTAYTVTAPETISNSIFVAWKDNATNEVVSYNRSYYFQVLGSTSLTALYTANDHQIDTFPIITISSARAIDDGGTHKISASVTRSIPEGCTLVEQGVLYSKEAHDDGALFLGSDFVYKYVSSSTSLNGVVNLNVRPANDTDVVSIRGYMILSKNGEQETYYSDIVSGSYFDLTHS